MLKRLVPVMLAFVATGCNSVVETRIDVGSNGGADISVLVEFDGEIVETLARDPELLEQLESVLRSRAARVEVVSSGREYVLQPTLTELRAAAGLTGIGDVAVTSDAGIAQVAVQTVVPTDLVAAIESSVAGQPDARQLAATMIANTHLEVRIQFRGDVVSNNGGVVDGTSVRYRDSVAGWDVGVLSASGELSGGGRAVYWVGGVIVAALTGAFVLRRSRKR